MSKDSLGDRMKLFYENRSKTYLTRRTPVIIRLDGCHFHTFTRGFVKPFDKRLMEAMQETTLALCGEIQGCVIKGENGFVIDKDIPIFTGEGREYIEKLIIDPN